MCGGESPVRQWSNMKERRNGDDKAGECMTRSLVRRSASSTKGAPPPPGGAECSEECSSWRQGRQPVELTAIKDAVDWFQGEEEWSKVAVHHVHGQP